MPQLVKNESKEKIEISDVREGERVEIEYVSAQSGNVVTHEGEANRVDRLGTDTQSFTLLADNGREYYVEQRSKVQSTGERSRQLSQHTNPDVYRLEALDLDSFEREEVTGDLRIRWEKKEVFDCPNCSTETASVNSINEQNVTISCGSCRKTMVKDDQPVSISLKIQR